MVGIWCVGVVDVDDDFCVLVGRFDGVSGYCVKRVLSFCYFVGWSLIGKCDDVYCGYE